jgi:hypothetical protein
VISLFYFVAELSKFNLCFERNQMNFDK